MIGICKGEAHSSGGILITCSSPDLNRNIFWGLAPISVFPFINVALPVNPVPTTGRSRFSLILIITTALLDYGSVLTLVVHSPEAVAWWYSIDPGPSIEDCSSSICSEGLSAASSLRAEISPELSNFQTTAPDTDLQDESFRVCQHGGKSSHKMDRVRHQCKAPSGLD